MIRVSPIAFAIAYIVTYLLVFWLGLPMFLYYPAPGMFHFGWTPVPNVGPGISWYGLMADAVVVGIIAGFAVPNAVLDRVLRNYVWVIPVLAVLACIFQLRNFFLTS